LKNPLPFWEFPGKLKTGQGLGVIGGILSQILWGFLHQNFVRAKYNIWNNVSKHLSARFLKF
jgi:hypothetical protein